MDNGAKLRSVTVQASLVTTALWLGCPSEAHAELQSTVNAVIASMQYLPRILSIAAALYGAGTIFSGAWKLKSHAEDPSKAPLMQGVSRIAIGGAFSVLPALMAYVNSSSP
jgi:type IV secretory pathway TraG/TraD family ATPase VirD4